MPRFATRPSFRGAKAMQSIFPVRYLLSLDRGVAFLQVPGPWANIQNPTQTRQFAAIIGQLSVSQPARVKKVLGT